MAKTFEEPTWLYHAQQGARLFLVGDEHPGDGWADQPFDRMPEADPKDAELQAARQRIAALESEVAELQAALSAKRSRDA